ncbi:hypothetical protein GW17_00042852 [Ensete ventricosum]|nr:hypothetical protein GW17_00042852 [Ensete ventricosum]
MRAVHVSIHRQGDEEEGGAEVGDEDVLLGEEAGDIVRQLQILRNVRVLPVEKREAAEILRTYHILLPCNGIIRSPSSSTKSSISVSLTEAGPTGTDSTVDFWGGVSKRVHLAYRPSCPPARAPCSGEPNLDQTQKNTRSILLLRESRGPMWAAGSVIDADAPSTCFT